MEVGIGYFGDIDRNPAQELAEQSNAVIQNIIEQSILADKLGLDVVAIGEHHREDYAVSAPHIVLAGIATVTKKIKLMSAVNVLSSSDPVALYQAYAIIQAMSGDRGEIGMGRGSFIESFPVFGYDLKDYEILFEEKFDLLRELIKNEKVTWKGEKTPELRNIGIYPRTKKEIPLWLAVGGTPSSVLRAAKHGIPLIVAIIGGQISNFKPLFDYYKHEYIKHGHPIEKMQIGVHTHTLLLKNEEEERMYFKKYAAQMDRIGKTRAWPSYKWEQFQAGMSPDGALFMGTEQQIEEKVRYVKELFGLTRFIAHMDVGAPGEEMLLNTIHAIANIKNKIVK